MKYWMKPGVLISAATYQGRTRPAIKRVPATQGRRRRLAPTFPCQSIQGTMAPATSTTASGPLDNRPMASPRKKP